MTDIRRDEDRSGADRWGVAAKAFAALLAVMAAWLIGGGAWLVALGGSPYYALAGLAYLAAAVLLWRRRAAGGWLVGAIFVVTAIWAVTEAGFAFWPLFPRLLLPMAAAGAGLLLLVGLSPRRRLLAGALAALCFVGVAATIALTFEWHGAVIGAAGDFRRVAGDNRPSDWTSFGRTTAGTRFASFDQIDRGNVRDLKVAWTFRSGDQGPGVDENTPLAVGDTVFTCSRNDRLAALDADSGRVRWRFDTGARSPVWQRCRSLGFAETPVAAGGPCARRILNTTVDARLIALDAATGRLCPGFGTDGVVDLKQGMGYVRPGYYFQTSGPLIARDKIVVAGWVIDNQQRGEPSGVVRAFDLRTGALAWAWDLGNPAITRLPPPGESYTRGTPNAWSTASYDDKLGLVYLPLGNETPDYYGMGRHPRSNLYNSSIVALDVATGRERWHVQTTHHDIWDYDLPSQPALVDLPDGRGGAVPALLQTTKRGQLFLVNRATGAPLSRIVERPAPTRGAAPSERLSPTQPFSPDMPTIGAELLTERRMWGMTMLDQLWCRVQFRKHRYDGPMTPIGPDWALQQPSNLGGLNWGSVSVDPVNHYAYMVDIRIPNTYKLVPRDAYDNASKRYPPAADGHGPSRMMGTPYGEVTEPWLSPLGVPCNQPPFGTITAVDLQARRIAWQVPAGTSEKSGPFGVATHLPMAIGMPAYAGATATAGGLLFFAGFQDYYLRAYDAATGRELWRHALPVGASATPMTYVSPRTGRQYVLVSVGGAAHSKVVGDYVIAFALPRRGAAR